MFGLVLLEVIAIALFIYGVLTAIHGQLIVGVLLMVLACAIGPGGWSIWA